MIFCGDIAVPSGEVGKTFISSLDKTGIVKNKTVVVNLEGVLKESSFFPYYKLFNDNSVLGFKDICKQVIFSLANNHVYDFPEDIQMTVSTLKEQKVGYFGLLEDDAIKPYEFASGGQRYAVFGHCWNLYTKTNANRKTKDRVVDCSYDDFYSVIRMYCRNHAGIRVICFPHWNFDFEELPFPAYVELAHDLIEAGAWCVVGNHTHCTQPIEIYQNKVICYSLGNLCIPDGVFFKGELSYPDESHKSYIVDISETEQGKATVYCCRTSPDGKCIVVETEQVTTSETADFNKLGGGYYPEKFKASRKKKRFTPVFATYHNTLGNKLKMRMLRWKVSLIRFVSKTKHKR